MTIKADLSDIVERLKTPEDLERYFLENYCFNNSIKEMLEDGYASDIKAWFTLCLKYLAAKDNGETLLVGRVSSDDFDNMASQWIYEQGFKGDCNFTVISDY